MKSIIAKLGNMRKAQDFIVYPDSGNGTITVQSDKSIGRFDKATGLGRLSTKGSMFTSLALHGIDFVFPKEFVEAAIAAQPQKGDSIGPGVILG